MRQKTEIEWIPVEDCLPEDYLEYPTELVCELDNVYGFSIECLAVIRFKRRNGSTYERVIPVSRIFESYPREEWIWEPEYDVVKWAYMPRA